MVISVCLSSRALCSVRSASPEGGGAPERRKYNWGTFAKAPARPCEGTRAFRRSTAAICYAATVLLSSDRGIFTTHVIQAALALPFIRRCPSHLRRAPHRGRTVTAPPGPGLRGSDAGAAPCTPNGSSPETPSVSKAAGRYGRKEKAQNRTPLFARSVNSGGKRCRLQSTASRYNR
jgi:hypothetical protein